MTDRSTTRRTVLSQGAWLASVGIATALAGCGGGDGGGGGSDDGGGAGPGDESTEGGIGTETDGATETERSAETTTETSSPQLRVLGAVGRNLTADGVGTVEITVTPSESAGTVSLQSMTVGYIGPSSSTTLWHESTTGSSNTAFRTTAGGSGTGSGSILTDASDRSAVAFDLGSGGAVDRLRPSESATVELRPDGGSPIPVELVVPSDLGDGDNVTLASPDG